MNGDPGGGLRGAALAGFSALLTAVGHVAGGGTVPDLAVLVLLLPLLAGLFAGLARRCRGVPAMIAVLGAGQFILHHLMELLHPANHPSAPPLLFGESTLWTHAAVTVVTAIALSHADQALAALVRALGRVLPRRLAPPPVDRPLPVLAVPGPAVLALLARAYAVCHIRRGPPVGAR